MFSIYSKMQQMDQQETVSDHLKQWIWICPKMYMVSLNSCGNRPKLFYSGNKRAEQEKCTKMKSCFLFVSIITHIKHIMHKLLLLLWDEPNRNM